MGQQGVGYPSAPSSPGGAGMTQVAPGSPVVYMVQDDAFLVTRQDPSQVDYSIRLRNPNAINVLHDAEISDSWRCWPFFFLTPKCWCWPWLKKRTYVRILEDSIEAEYPCICFPFCCESCVVQNHPCTHRKHFFSSCCTRSVKAARCCTPYHLCCCIPCSGEVVSLAPCDSVNCFLCCCLLQYVPGLENSERFARVANKARYHYEEGEKANDTNMRPSAFVQERGAVQMTAPPAQVMMGAGGVQNVPSAPQMPGMARNAW